MSLSTGRTSRLVSVAVKNARVNTSVPMRSIQLNLPIAIRKWMYDLSAFNQYGLYKHDILIETEDVAEALRSLPNNLQDERTFRMYRPTQLYMQKTILPKDQWPTFEEDVEHGRYLDQYLEEVQREKAEKSMWAKR